MKVALALAALVLVGCGGGGGSPSLDRDWIDQTSDTTAAGINFRSDGTYTALNLVVTSAFSGGGTANVEVETGTFSATQNTIDMVPATYTCAGTDPPYSMGYHFSNGNLVLSTPAGINIFAPNNSPASSNTTLTYGCFAGGVFTPGPAMPTGN